MIGKIKNAFNRIVWTYLPSCKDVTALISRSRENNLSRREKLVMKIHLYTCIACQRYLEQVKFMSEVFKTQGAKAEKGEFAPKLSPEAAERLKKAIKTSNVLLFFALLNFY